MRSSSADKLRDRLLAVGRRLYAAQPTASGRLAGRGDLDGARRPATALMVVITPSRPRATPKPMSYTLSLPCGCVVYVSCHPVTRMAHTRVIQTRASSCRDRRHDIGARLYLWEMLPTRGHAPALEWSDDPYSATAGTPT